MKNRFHSRTGGISFFAFQDIITGTAGFLIVIAVLLSLDVTQVPGLIPSPQDQQESAEQKKLDATLAEVTRLQDRVAKLQTVPRDSPEELQRKIAALRDAVAALAAQDMEATASRPATPEELRLIIEKQKQITAAQEAEKQKAELQKKNAGASAEIAALEAELKKAEEALKQSISKKNVIKLIPGEGRSTKKPLIIVVQSSQYILHDIDSHRTQQATSLPSLESQLSTLPPASHFLVLYYKPSAAGSFGSLNQRMRALEYEIGYDLLPEAIQLEF